MWQQKSDHSGSNSMNEMSSSGSIAVVTGAAGSMGAATARKLFQAGWNDLLLCDREGGALEDVSRKLREAGASVSQCVGEMSDGNHPSQIVAALNGRNIGALVHMAGLGPHQGDPALVIDVNLGGSTRLVEAVRDHMAPGSAAVLIASNSAYFPKRPEAAAAFSQPLSAEGITALLPLAPTQEEAYPLSKLGVIALVKREAKSFGLRGSRLLSLSPGATDTNMFRFEAEVSTAGVVATMLERAAIPRVGTPQEIASVAVFLCSPAAGFLAGADILVDGGQVAGMGF
jgi:NAD(P)-dependent dehydrogenase (short-subunit alcohol dehydrogenase family)